MKLPSRPPIMPDNFSRYRDMIAENLSNIRNEIEASARKAGRTAEKVKLVAVSKRFPVQNIVEAFVAGQIHFGENYIQEVQEKNRQLPDAVQIHFIGHLQSNKAKTAVETCSMVETVDSFKLGKTLNKFAQAADKPLHILVQVNIADDSAKAGVTAENTEKLLTELKGLAYLRIKGLMTMPPFSNNPELSRPHFSNLRELAFKMAEKKLFDGELEPEISMGMSNDFPIAIEEGATIVRVGTAIFGRRPR